uniref:CSON010170 protein n=1 Tax=Culicoides sonorensis TaxID=179676 RepID=A0A336LLP5_CULSO
MIVLHIILLLFCFTDSYTQFVPLFKHESLKVDTEVPLEISYTEKLSDCPLKYFKYGGSTLISSTALDLNNHHIFSHYVLLGEIPSLVNAQHESNIGLSAKIKPKCIGLIISTTWILIEKECVLHDDPSVYKIRTGVNKFGEWNKKEGELIDVVRIVTQPTTTKFVLLETKEINIDINVSPVCLWTQSTSIFDTVSKINFESKKFSLEENVITFDWRNNNTKLFETSYLQKYLVFGSRLVPFVILPENQLDINGLKWIEKNTNFSFQGYDCATRFINQRFFEPYVSRATSYNDEEAQQIIPLNALIQSSKRFYRALITWQDSDHTCIGSLISDRHVIATANCISKLSEFPSKIVLQYNPYNELEYTESVNIKSIKIHPGYNNKNFVNDIALIKLNDSVALKNGNIHPACIPNFDIEKLGKPHRQTGKDVKNCPNFLYDGDKCSSKKDNFGSVKLIISNVTSRDACEKIYKKRGIDIDHIDEISQFCSGNLMNLVPDTCETDIGGSVGREIFLHNHYFHFLFGMISYGKDCGFGTPSLVTRLSHFIPWLNKEMFGFEMSNLTEDANHSPIVKTDQPKEVSVLLKFNDKNKKACMGVVIGNQSILTHKNCIQDAGSLADAKITLLDSNNNSVTTSIKEFNEESSFVNISFNNQLPMSSNEPINVWNKNDTIPFKLMVEGVDPTFAMEKFEVFALFPDVCYINYNITLAKGEFCIESLFDESEKDLLNGSPVWQYFNDWLEEEKTHESKFGLLVGLVKKTWKETNKIIAIVKTLSQSMR